MGNYSFTKTEGGEKGKFFCSPHYRQLFLSHPEVINYSRAREQPKEGAPKQTSTEDGRVDIFNKRHVCTVPLLMILHAGCKDITNTCTKRTHT
jgi:YHS domain-containing protein